MPERLKNQSGFTLIELLIVVIIMGILALAIIPQITLSSDEAKVNTLKNNLTAMRNAIELYYHEHGKKYPGDAVPTTKPADVTDTVTAFAAQLTRYTDVDGNISNTYVAATFKYGPYIKGGKLPANPFNEKNDVAIDNTETDITVRTADLAANETDWKFFTKTGVLIANNDGGTHASY